MTGLNIGLRPFLWGAVALLLLLSIPTPLGFISVFLMMAPLIVLYRLLKPGLFVAAVAAILLLAYLLSGGAGLVVVVVGLFFLVPAAAMGYAYKKGWPARTALLIGSAVLLALLLLELALFSVQFGVTLSDELTAEMTRFFQDAARLGNLMTQDEAADAAANYIDMLMLMLPTLLLYSSFLLALAAHGLSKWALRRTDTPLAALPPARTWKVSRSLVFIFVAALFVNLFILPAEGSYLETVLANLIPVLKIVFTVQAIGFVFFVAHAKQWPRVVPILLAVPIIFLSEIFYLVGLIDAAFPLRKLFEKKA